MTSKQQNLRRRGWVLSTLLVLSVAACSGKDRSDLVLVDVDLNEVPSATSLNMALLAASTQAELKRQTVATPALQNGIAKIGLTQPSGLAGDIVVSVVASDSSGILGAGTSASVTVVAGQNVGPVTVTVKKTAVLPDGGSPDTVTPDAGAPDSVGYDVGGRNDADGLTADTGSGGGFDGQPPDGPPAADGRPDAATDVVTLAEAGADVTFADAAIDAATDVPTFTDVPPVADVGADGAEVRPDAPADVVVSPDAGNILGTLSACKKYVHFPDSPLTCQAGSQQERILVNTTTLTPDGKYLVTAANNSWVKLWKVVAGGLEDTNIVLLGESYYITATLSPTGTLLALTNPSGNVALFDLPQTLAQGSGVQVGTLGAAALTNAPNWDYHQAFFTSDEKQIVMIYSAANARIQQGGSVAVWDLTTRAVLSEFTFDDTSQAFTVSNAAASGPLWTVIGKFASVSDDAGTHDQTTVSLVDVSGTTTVKPTFVVRGKVSRATFSADNRVLAAGTTDNEITIWDLSTLNNIQPLGSPLVAGGSGETVYGLAFSSDGQFLTAGSWMDQAASHMWIVDLQTRAVVKRNIEYEPRSFAFGADHTTWAYGLGGCGFLYFCK